MCNDYLKVSDYENALNCVENATNTAIKLYKWGTDNCMDNLILEDIVYFVKHTPMWCFNQVYSNYDNPFTIDPRYQECIKRISDLIK